MNPEGLGANVNLELCDVCGSANVKEIKCKLICQHCGTILRSCADLLHALKVSCAYVNCN